MSDLIEQLKPHMKALEFVEWDRYTVGAWNSDVDHITAYGWIERGDNYKDYIQLETWSGTDNIAFTTSSSEYSEQIHKTLFDEPVDEHNECQRVENALDIDNVVEL